MRVCGPILLGLENCLASLFLRDDFGLWDVECGDYCMLPILSSMSCWRLVTLMWVLALKLLRFLMVNLPNLAAVKKVVGRQA